jgi:hypothetical protein
MFDDLKLYLFGVRLRLMKQNREDIPLELLMVEISRIAVENWMDEKDPELTNEQLLIASRRVIAKKYNRN